MEKHFMLAHKLSFSSVWKHDWAPSVNISIWPSSTSLLASGWKKKKRKGKWAQHSRRSYITIKGMLELCRCLLDHLTLAHKVGPPIPRTYQFCSTRLSKRTTHLAQSEGRGWVCLDVHSFYCLQVFLSKTLNWINYKTHQVPSQIHLHTIIR